MERRLYDFEGLLRLLAAVFDLAHREAQRGNTDAVYFLDTVCPNRRKPAVIDSKQIVNENESQLEARIDNGN